MKIESEKSYSFNSIVKLGLLGVTQRDSLKTIIIDDFISDKKILQPVKIGTGKGSMYFIKGENLIKYLDEKNGKNEEIKKSGSKKNKTGKKNND